MNPENRAFSDFDTGDKIVPSHDYSNEEWRITAISSNGMIMIERLSDGETARTPISSLSAYEKVE